MPDGREWESGGIAGICMMEIRRQRSSRACKKLGVQKLDRRGVILRANGDAQTAREDFEKKN
jgi:hypothetical protein